ncbi:MAG TPA: quinoprotein relay system zinc metallohydrolase 2 [Stellaceae bacterium]
MRRALLIVAVAAAVAGHARADEPSMLPTVEAAPGIFVHAGVQQNASPENGDEIANTGFIVGDDAVMVVDPGGSETEGRRLRAAVRARTALPIRYVVLTHVHPDHIFGAAAFSADGPAVIGHERLPGALAQRGAFYERTLRRDIGDAAAEGSAVVQPTLLVHDKLDLDLGNRPITIRAHGPAHTDNDLSIADARTGTLWLSDLLFVDRIPVLDGSVVGWLKELASLREVRAARAIPGHGPVSVPWPAGSDGELRYLTELADETRVAIRSNVGIAEAPNHVCEGERGRWLLFDDYNPRNVTAAYKELEWE